MTRTSGGGSVILAAIMLVGCAAEPPHLPAAARTAPHRPAPQQASPSPIKQDVQEIKTTIGKLKRKLDKREKLAPADPPT